MSKVREHLKSVLGEAGANGALSKLAKGQTAFTLAKAMGYEGEDDDGDGEDMEKSFALDRLSKALGALSSAQGRPMPQRPSTATIFAPAAASIETAVAGDAAPLLKSLVDQNAMAHRASGDVLDEVVNRLEAMTNTELAIGHGMANLIKSVEEFTRAAREENELLRGQNAALLKALGAPDAPRAVQGRPRLQAIPGGAAGAPNLQAGQAVPSQTSGLSKSQATRLLAVGMAKAQAIGDQAKMVQLSHLAPQVETADPQEGVDHIVAAKLTALAQ